MLSYRHAFHAGNHADVLKHWVLSLCLQYLKNKPKPIFYLDTHAGSGRYSLSDAFAEKTGEYQGGIGRLWQAEAPAVFSDYLQVVQQENGAGLAHYPGSCVIAARLLRADDQLCLAEMHSTDQRLLRANLGRDKRVRIIEGDGFGQLKAALPPASRRGLVLIDPSYELKSDYGQVLEALKAGLQRFATGTYLVWYPLLASEQVEQFRARLPKIGAGKWLNVTLSVSAKPQGHGMYGSGMLVINPPYTLRENLNAGLPWLSERLALDDQAGYQIQFQD
ncbi:23S rRNA (adenine(2030)-N(6))-methyltransferase RlmJ [Halioxenophilus sp. WMMB6]|uniref:23S rRNA (adenine(2030)-N(6))-methyltransferase RlmJ n=1 Tax=Halioxenophilus sp. WMMB6 TaxID=3073815 RepID=UPI00295E2601|nr:23S rRNA (adenine(2030)-N(6))-methyltransferase RlmJ [Halioxenophilus sp. WMMB6]